MNDDPRSNDELPPPGDELDSLLREWHDANAATARAGRDRLLAALAAEDARPSAATSPVAATSGRVISFPRRLRIYSPLAAAAAILLALGVMFLLPQTTPKSFAGGTIMCPDGGRLDALDPDGNILGPCELKHTDVKAEVSGFFSRVTLRQQYHNPHPSKIEAVYTFPMSHRAAVDRMTMTIGDRVIVGEVKERQQARQIYEAARAEGRVASLLEQERPNIFTQSVANIEPGASIDIEISYVEILEPTDGVYSFEFPTVVGPRYIPGIPTGSAADENQLPVPLARRTGLVLLAPAVVKITASNEAATAARAGLTPAQLSAALASSIPTTGGMVPKQDPGWEGQPAEWHRFQVEYPDGSAEPGVLFTDGTGAVNGRWFYAPSLVDNARGPDAGHRKQESGLASPGSNFASNTTQVPDASKITPMPVRPPTRAGHDISISVTIDTGGPPIRDLTSPLHDIVRTDGPGAGHAQGGPARTIVTLKDKSEIPNRDFILSWKTAGDTIQESTLAHTGKNGNFLSLILQPPARVEPEQIVPRELIFVLDTSGSMNGFPIEKSKELAAKAIEQMRPGDTFNIITFAGDTHILWNQPRPNTPENRAEAQRFVTTRSGSGGTEMMKAINAALAPSAGEASEEPPIGLQQLIDKPADGSRVTVDVGHVEILLNAKGAAAWGRLRLRGHTDDSMEILVTQFELPSLSRSDTLYLSGRWTTVNTARVLNVESVRVVRLFGGPQSRRAAKPLRIVLFLTDAYVGNEFTILDAIKANRGTTRVFPLGIGNSVNRFLIDSMARLGGGESEVVTLAGDADEAVRRLVHRIDAPVLSNIKVEFQAAPGSTAKLVDQVPTLNSIPDLFDQRPLNLLSRYTGAGKGTLVITGDTAAGPYRREIALDLPASAPEHDTVATLWARAKVDSLMNEDLKAVQSQTYPDELRQEVIRLGESFGIMTQYTSFVAVDKLRVTVGGKPRLVHIPIELPQGVSWKGNFGGSDDDRERARITEGDYLFLDYDVELASFAGDEKKSAPFGEVRAGADRPDNSLGVLGTKVLSVQPDDATRQIALQPSPPAGLTGGLVASPEPAAKRAPAAKGLEHAVDASMGESEKQVSLETTTATPALNVDSGAPTATTPVSKPRPATEETRKAPGVERTGGAAPPAAPAKAAPPRGIQPAASTPPPVTGAPALAFSNPNRVKEGPNSPALPGRTAKDDSALSRGSSDEDRADALARYRVRLRSLERDQAGGQSLQGLTDYPTDQRAGRLRAGFELTDLSELSEAAQLEREIPARVPADWIAVRIAALAAKSDLTKAGELATQLAAAAPAYAIGVEMHQLLSAPTPPADTAPATSAIEGVSGKTPETAGSDGTDQVVDKAKAPDAARGIARTPTPSAIPPDAAARDARIAELGKQARARLDELIRRATLAHKLDPRLLTFALDSTGLPTAFSAGYAGPWPEQTTVVDSGVLLSVLVHDTTAATLGKLKAAGLRVEQVAADVHVIVGVLPLGRLAELALIDQVRRVEPTE